ncbi:hypothetical protein [Hymenobacter properus]|uniref:Transmembrane protein n=1 Tax=Hymenobacter properus TaxID=2791026 RepID=A0A931BIG2_9BACT|nr:hypothetical protein [Hymenobacter properus]MBF9140080.1 hypothetical protein [Hymenobacter properus]MBR7718887.1 hypothetical protein [Microvirga sp. SRT04]
MLLRCLLFCLCLNTHLAQAQEAPAPRPVRDSAYAVHNLFRDRRQRALKGGSLGLAGLAGAGLAAAYKQPGLSGGLLLLCIGTTALDLRQLSRYSESRETLVATRYEQGWPLPPDVRRRLKAKYFHAFK